MTIVGFISRHGRERQRVVRSVNPSPAHVSSETGELLEPEEQAIDARLVVPQIRDDGVAERSVCVVRAELGTHVLARGRDEGGEARE